MMDGHHRLTWTNLDILTALADGDIIAAGIDVVVLRCRKAIGFEASF